MFSNSYVVYLKYLVFMGISFSINYSVFHDFFLTEVHDCNNILICLHYPLSWHLFHPYILNDYSATTKIFLFFFWESSFNLSNTNVFLYYQIYKLAFQRFALATGPFQHNEMSFSPCLTNWHRIRTFNAFSCQRQRSPRDWSDDSGMALSAHGRHTCQTLQFSASQSTFANADHCRSPVHVRFMVFIACNLLRPWKDALAVRSIRFISV